jgi:hypothetical protein
MHEPMNLVGVGQAAAQGIQEQMFAKALALGEWIDRQPAQQRDGQLRIARQLVSEFVWQVGQSQHRGR